MDKIIKEIYNYEEQKDGKYIASINYNKLEEYKLSYFLNTTNEEIINEIILSIIKEKYIGKEVILQRDGLFSGITGKISNVYLPKFSTVYSFDIETDKKIQYNILFDKNGNTIIDKNVEPKYLSNPLKNEHYGEDFLFNKETVKCSINMKKFNEISENNLYYFKDFVMFDNFLKSHNNVFDLLSIDKKNNIAIIKYKSHKYNNKVPLNIIEYDNNDIDISEKISSNIDDFVDEIYNNFAPLLNNIKTLNKNKIKSKIKSKKISYRR